MAGRGIMRQLVAGDTAEHSFQGLACGRPILAAPGGLGHHVLGGGILGHIRGQQGAQHVVDSSADTFVDDLTDALRATGATIAFDAIGGGDLAGVLLSRMEKVASEQAGEFSRYGSDTHKQVYIYGGLDRGPTTLRRDFGMSWAIGGWLLMPFLAKIGPEAADGLRQRVADEITTTFASSYGMQLSLADAVDPDTVARYGRMATGDKAVVTPQA